MLIVTLSSIPPRFSRIAPALNSLLAQTASIDGIYLYIPQSYRRFPDWDGTLPEVPQGVEIRRTETDLGPATKILPATRDFAGQDVDILFCDDDRAYARDWAAGFLRIKAAHPGCAIARRGLMADGLLGTRPTRQLQPRALSRRENKDIKFRLKHLWWRLTGKPGRPERRLFHRSGYIDMFEGCSGVLVRPDYFDDAAFDIPAIAWRVDDVWLSGMLAKAGIPIWLEANMLTPQNTDAQTQAPLAAEVIGGAGRHQVNQAAAQYLQDTYGIWLG